MASPRLDGDGSARLILPKRAARPPGIQPVRGARRRGRTIVARLGVLVAGGVLLTAIPLALIGPGAVPAVLAVPLSQASCGQPGSGDTSVPNWGDSASVAVTPCATGAQDAANVPNWGSSVGSATGSNPVDAATGGPPVLRLNEGSGEAAAEVGGNFRSVPVLNLPATKGDGNGAPVLNLNLPNKSNQPVVIDLHPPTRKTDQAPVIKLPPVKPGQTPGQGVPAVKPPSVTALDPKWAAVEQWNQDILVAQQQVNAELGVLVPTNVIKSIIMIETQGVMPSSANADSAAGLMQITPGTIGAAHFDFRRLLIDPGYSIYCGTYELALRYGDSKQQPWRNVIVGYFSGHYEPTGARDAYSSDFQYQRAFDTYMAELEAVGALGGQVSVQSGTGAGGAAVIPGNWLAGQNQPINGLAYIWGNTLVDGGLAPLSQEFGPTDFSVNVHPDWYQYSLEYGFTQPGHTGLDVAIQLGTPLYAPAESTVVCSGTGNSNGEDGCAAFASSSGGPTSGRLQLRLPGGDMLIYGHVSSCVVAPGQTVKIGQLVGYSGSMNGDHVHIEYRIKDPSTTAGWRLIDPRLTPLNGNRVNVVPGVAPTVPAPQVTPRATEQPTEAVTQAPPVPVAPEVTQVVTAAVPTVVTPAVTAVATTTPPPNVTATAPAPPPTSPPNPVTPTP